MLEVLSAKGPLSEESCANLMKGVVDAISYLHNMGIVHRDLKLENLMLESNDPDALVKIGDFGLAR